MHDILFQNEVFQLWPATTVVIAAFVIGYSTGGLPGGASLAAPILTLAIPFEHAQAAVLPMLVFSQVFALFIHWKSINWRELAFVVLLSSVGIGIGWFVWSLCLDLPEFPTIRKILKFSTAILTIALAVNLYVTRIRKPPIPPPALGIYLSCFWCIIAGTLSTIANVAGPLVVWFLNTRHLRKESLTATVAVSFLLINSIKFVPYTALGFYDADNFANLFRDVVATLPVFLLIFISILIGKWQLHRASQQRFDIAIVTAMAIVASSIIWQVGPDMMALLR